MWVFMCVPVPERHRRRPWVYKDLKADPSNLKSSVITKKIFCKVFSCHTSCFLKTREPVMVENMLSTYLYPME